MHGELTDELGNKSISNFVLIGAKSYNFRYGDNQQNSCIKGFTLVYENSNILNHDSMVKTEIKELTIINENKIKRK